MCPPHSPQKKDYAEWLVKSYRAEHITRNKPGTEEAAREVTEAFLAHYHDERPHQGRGLRNLSPRVAFPTLPSRPRCRRSWTLTAGWRPFMGKRLLAPFNRTGA